MITGGRLLLGSLTIVLCTVGASAQVSDDERPKVESEAKLQAEEADKLYASGQYNAALPLYQAERTSRNALGDQRYEALATRAVGCCLEKLGQFDEAIAAWREAIVIDSKREDRGFEGYDHLLIAKVEHRRDQPDSAMRALAEAIPLLSKVVDADHESIAQHLFGQILNDRDEFIEAKVHLRRAFELVQTLKLNPLRARILGELGRASFGLEEFQPAADALVESSRIFEAEKMNAEAAWADRLLGDTFMELGRTDDAKARVAKSAERHRALGAHGALANDLCFLASLALKDRPTEALKLAKEAVESAKETDDTALELDAMVHLALAQSQSKDPASAAATIEKSLSLAKRLEDRSELVRILFLAASFNRAAGNFERASIHATAAKTLSESPEDP